MNPTTEKHLVTFLKNQKTEASKVSVAKDAMNALTAEQRMGAEAFFATAADANPREKPQTKSDTVYTF